MCFSGCGGIKCFLMLMGIAGIAAAVWYGGSADAGVCFNLTAGEAMSGSNTNAWYDVAEVAFEKNGTFWNNGLSGYYEATSEQFHVFRYAENSSHVFIMFPVIENLASGANGTYCIYSGGSSLENIREVAPLGVAFDDSITHLTRYNYSECDYSMTDGILNITDLTDACGLRYSTTSMNVNGTLVTAFRQVTSPGSGIYSGIFVNDGYWLTGSGFGIGIRGSNFSAGWYNDATPGTLQASDTDWHIARLPYYYGATTTGRIYNMSMSQTSSATTTNAADYGNPRYTYLAYVLNSNALFNWSISFGRVDTKPSVNNIVYDAMDPNITILAPESGQSFSDRTTVTINVYYGKSYDNCTVYINDAEIDYYEGISSGSTIVSIVGSNETGYGTNYVNVSCYDTSESHAYTDFIKIGSAAPSLFFSAFGIDITSLCSGPVLAELSDCFEYYRLTQYYNFSAVACRNLDPALNYSCIGRDNFTKNGFTLFYEPDYWSYASSGVNIQHTGAWFYYNGVPITDMNTSVSIELINSTKFFYGPAQTRERDCGIYYSSTSYCSYWGGFIINTQPVIISDNSNNWYIAGGNLIVGYNENYSQQVAPVSVLKLVETSGIINNQSIITRSSCEVKNGTLQVNVVNTLPVLYTVTVNGDTSYSYSVTNYELSTSIPLSGVSNATIYSNDQIACAWGSTESLWLPFNFTWLSDGFSGVMVVVFMLFMVILSAIIPYAFLFIFIFNDMYHILSIIHIAALGVFCVIIGLVNSSFNIDRGIKHLLVYMAIFVAFLASVSTYQTELGIDLDTYTGLLDAFYLISQPTTLFDVAVGVFTIIVSIFVLILTLPVHVSFLILQLLGLISPVIAAQAATYSIILTVGIYIALFLKGYEVVRNTFLKV